MKTFFKHLRDIIIAGFLFLVPVYVLIIIFNKAWGSLSKIGVKLAALFGLNSVFGVGGATIFSFLVLTAIWLACGLLVRISYVGAFNRAIESRLVKYVPGYATYRATIQEKLDRKEPPRYACALFREGDSWRPAMVIEEDGAGACVLFLPAAPGAVQGSVVLARREELSLVPSWSSKQLEEAMKKKGKGLLTELGLPAGMALR